MITHTEIKYLLETDGNIEERIEKEYRPLVKHDHEMSAWLNTVPHFGSWGEFYEVVEYFNQMLGINPDNQPLNC